MPYYDLYCPECENEFNISASMTEKINKKIACPECGAHDLQTVFKAPPAYIKSAGLKAPECPNRHVCGMGCRHAG